MEAGVPSPLAPRAHKPRFARNDPVAPEGTRAGAGFKGVRPPNKSGGALGGAAKPPRLGGRLRLCPHLKHSINDALENGVVAAAAALFVPPAAIIHHGQADTVRFRWRS